MRRFLEILGASTSGALRASSGLQWDCFRKWSLSQVAYSQMIQARAPIVSLLAPGLTPTASFHN